MNNKLVFLDCGVISRYLNSDNKHFKAREIIEKLTDEGYSIVTSHFVKLELLDWVFNYRGRHPDKINRQLFLDYKKTIENILEVDYTESANKIFGELYKKNYLLGAVDLTTTSICIDLDIELLTKNKKDFIFKGLRLINHK